MKVLINELNITLRLMREVQGLSQTELGIKANLRQGSISYSENNKGDTSIGTINNIASALGYDLYFVFEKKHEPKPPKENQSEGNNITNS